MFFRPPQFQHVEPGVRQVVEAGVDLGVVVVQLDPSGGERSQMRVR